MSWLKTLFGIEEPAERSPVIHSTNDYFEDNCDTKTIEQGGNFGESTTIIRYYDDNRDIIGVSFFSDKGENNFYIHFDNDGSILDTNIEKGKISEHIYGVLERGDLSYDIERDKIFSTFENEYGGKVEKSITALSDIYGGDFYSTGHDYRMVGCDEYEKAEILDRLTISGNELEQKEFIHTGPNKIDNACMGYGYFTKSECTNRPDVGGFWGSISDDPKTSISQWNDYVRMEGLDHKRSEFVTTFSISQDAKVLYISNGQDLSDLAKAYPGHKDMIIVEHNDGKIFDRDSCLSLSIDWESVSKDYDVFVADSWFYRYDIDYSIVVFNTDVVTIENSVELSKYVKENDMNGEWKDYVVTGNAWDGSDEYDKFVSEKFDGYDIEGIYITDDFYSDYSWKSAEITTETSSDGHLQETYKSSGYKMTIEYTDSTREKICEITSVCGYDEEKAVRILTYNEDKEIIRSVYTGTAVDYDKNGETAVLYKIETVTDYDVEGKHIVERYFSTECYAENGGITIEHDKEFLYKIVEKEYIGDEKDKIETKIYDKDTGIFIDKVEKFENGKIDKIDIIEKTGDQIKIKTELYFDGKLSQIEISEKVQLDGKTEKIEVGVTMQVSNTDKGCDKIVLFYREDGKISEIEYQTMDSDGKYIIEYTEEFFYNEVTEMYEVTLYDCDGNVIEEREITQKDTDFVLDYDVDVDKDGENDNIENQDTCENPDNPDLEDQIDNCDTDDENDN